MCDISLSNFEGFSIHGMLVKMWFIISMDIALIGSVNRTLVEVLVHKQVFICGYQAFISNTRRKLAEIMDL